MIAPMSRLEIITLSEIRSEVVAFLQENGLVQLDEVPVEVDTDDGVVSSALISKCDLEDSDAARLTSFEDLDRTLAEVIPMLVDTPAPAALEAGRATAAGWSEDELAANVNVASDTLRSATRDKAKLQDTISVLTTFQSILEQVAPSLGRDTKLGKGSRALALQGNVAATIESLKSRFAEEVAGASVHFKQTGKREAVGLITFADEHEETANRILSQEGVTPVDMRDAAESDSTIGEVLAKVSTTLQNHHATIGELNTQIRELSDESGAVLRGARAVVADIIGQLRAQRSFGSTEMLTVIHGWTPTDVLGDLRHKVNEAFPGQVTVSELDKKDVPAHQIPTQLRNPKLFQPFELVLKLFNPPTYGSTDPTILVGLSFTLFYGFIVGDVFYGLAIIGFFMWLTSKFKHIEAMADVRKIGIYAGSSTIFFGVLYGEYGGEWSGIPYIWMHRLPSDPVPLMIWSLYFGMAHIVLALCLGIYENWRHNHKSHALEKAGMLLGLISLIIISYSYFGVAPFDSTPMLALAGILFGAGAVLIFRAMGVMGMIGILEIMSLGGNVISYARLMALGVAAVAIAGIANELPESLGLAIGIPAAIFIHIVNILISIASPTIHAMRLNVVEFLPKFFEPDGRGYAPFKKETQS